MTRPVNGWMLIAATLALMHPSGRSRPLPHPRHYVVRQLKFAFAALLIVGVSLGLGVWGYRHYAGFSTVDAFLNASMILGGMGPVNDLPNDDAKWFASIYALFSGIALLTTVAVLLAPLVHRGLHWLHLEDERKAARDGSEGDE